MVSRKLKLFFCHCIVGYTSTEKEEEAKNAYRMTPSLKTRREVAAAAWVAPMKLWSKGVLSTALSGTSFSLCNVGVNSEGTIFDESGFCINHRHGVPVPPSPQCWRKGRWIIDELQR